MAELGTVREVFIENEMRTSYLDYAMSVIVSRALPDVRDGLKPVHRRILYTMHEMGLRQNAKYRKSAGVVGDALRKYHPHGDAALYDAIVRMAQDFSMRYLLVDGQGNFGSVDGDPPAAYRYTECRMTAIAEELLADIDKNTVDFIDNYDASEREPTVLPARFPNLLVNGSAGIAVGMATNIPPHNLNEVIDAVIHLIDHPAATADDLCKIVRGPDFPTGGIILGNDGIRSAYTTGHGRVLVRAKYGIEEARGGRYNIIVSELPYQINKAALCEKIGDLVRDKKIAGLSGIRDESDRDGMRIVIEVARDGRPQQVINQLYKHTALQSAFGVNMLALVDNAPVVLTLKSALMHYINHRREVVRRRTEFELEKAKARAHILEGLTIAIDHLDEVIAIIRAAESAEAASTTLQQRFKLSELQARAILDMQLRRLAQLERSKIAQEYQEVLALITELQSILDNPTKMMGIIKADLREVKKKYGDQRRTVIYENATGEMSDEDLIPLEEVVVTLTDRGYIKRVPAGTYRTQRRGGRGVTGMQTRESDLVKNVIFASTHDNLLFFTNRGKVFQLVTHELPDTSRQAKGTPLINLISIDPNERVTGVLKVTGKTLKEGQYLVMVTRRGEIKRVEAAEFASVRRAGLVAFDLEGDDELAWIKLTNGKEEVVLVTKRGMAVRFSEALVPTRSRTAGGVRAIKLEADDEIVDVDLASAGTHMLMVTVDGYGKRTKMQDFPAHGRGTKGVMAMELRKGRGPIVSARAVNAKDELLVITRSGMVVRMKVGDIATQGRLTQGVRVITPKDGDEVASIEIAEASDEANGNGANGHHPRRVRGFDGANGNEDGKG